MNDCQCTIPDGGWCERHKMLKSSHWVHLCRTRENYWSAWEAGVGPGQLHDDGKSVPRTVQPSGAGTLLGRMLGCGGFRHATRMNELGPDGCEQHMEQILAWMREQRKNISEEAARRLIGLAISRARELNLER